MTHDLQLARLQQQVDKFYSPPAEAMAKANPAGEPGKATQISGEEFMAKALVSVGLKHLTTAQLTEAELCINAGKRPPEPIVRCVIDGVPYSPWG